jgi:hypothetical protein
VIVRVGASILEKRNSGIQLLDIFRNLDQRENERKIRFSSPPLTPGRASESAIEREGDTQDRSSEERVYTSA